MSLPLLSPNAVPGVSSSPLRNTDASKHCRTLATARRSDWYPRSSSPRGVRKTTMTRLNATGFAEVEPDLNEDPIDRWETPSIDSEDFVYGIYDGHHTYYEGGEKVGLDQTFDRISSGLLLAVHFTMTVGGDVLCDKSRWDGDACIIVSVYDRRLLGNTPGRICVGRTTYWLSRLGLYPVLTAGVISWLFLPTVALAMYLDVPGEYLYIGAALYTAVFCIIEMNKPDKPHNFEPQIYNMERGARDKLIADYNSMDIWDFNEKYGDLWDFTVKKDDITKR